jgi:hypothetical protein
MYATLENIIFVGKCDDVFDSFLLYELHEITPNDVCGSKKLLPLFMKQSNSNSIFCREFK